MKLKLHLNNHEFQALFNVLHLALTERTADPDLKRQIGEYCISSVLYELYTKVNKKSSDLAWFASLNRISVLTITRSESLAFYFLFTSEEDVQPAVLYKPESYEFAVLSSIIGQIHQAYLV
jgi:hypothetical protein